MSWEAKLFRDCNGESNGIELPEETVQAEGEEGGDFVFPGDPLDGQGQRLAQQSAPPLSVLPPPEEAFPVSGLYLPPAEV